MPDYIPFVNTKGDFRMLTKYFSDAGIIRIPLESANALKSQIPGNMDIWVDPGVDGYEHHLKNKQEPIPSYLRVCNDSNILADSAGFKKPNKERLRRFVHSLMDSCLKLKPSLITVPQLPMVDGATRNKINMELARSTHEWKLKRGFKGRLILPVIFTHQNQYQGKTRWKPRIDSVLKWCSAAGTDYLWVVDSNLSDQKGTSTLRSRFAELIEMHSYLKDSLRKGEIIAGPYWGMNLILWARNLCDHPAISLGTAYQYHLSGAPFRRKGTSRIAIPSLKRWVVVKPELRDWLAQAIKTLSSEGKAFENLEPVKRELEEELNNLSSRYHFLDEESNRDQVTRFYREWLIKLENVPKAGRTLALYQDFSSAYVLGKHLPTLPASGNSARRPERVAEYFMLNCL
jgi:hypothetical protein